MDSLVTESMELKRKSDIHIARKLWHFFGVLCMIVLHNNLTYHQGLIVLGVAWILFVPADFLRLFNPSLNKFAVGVFQLIMRKSEEHRLSGNSYLLTGVLIVLLVFPKSIVALSLFFLGFADPIASYFGIRYGRDKVFGEKTIQGSIAAFVICTLVSMAFFYANNIMVERLLIVSILAGLGGALAELIPIWKLDDNLTLPVLSATWLYFIFALFGGLN